MMMKVVEDVARKRGVDLAKVKRYGLEQRKEFSTLSSLAHA